MKKALEILKYFFAICAILCLTSNIEAFLFYLIFSIVLHYINKNIKVKYNTEFSDVKKKSYTKTALYSEYYKKDFLTPYELSFYNKIKVFNNDYIIIPQLNLATIIDKSNSKYRNELFRNIDFAIFNKNFELLLLIELDDSSHMTPKRKDRDLKVKKILNDCGIKLIKFYTYYPNEADYVIKRINQFLADNTNQNIK